MKLALKRFLACLFLLYFVLVSACSPVGPNYSPPELPLPDKWKSATDVPSANSSRRWWNLFDDQQLLELVEKAFAANKNLKAAQSRVLAARARSVMAGADTLPGGGLSSSYTALRKSETTGSSGGEQDLFQFGFDASWEIDVFGGQRRTIESATASLAASEEALRDALISIEAEVARNYFELRGNQSRLETARKTLALQQSTLEIVQGRKKLGLAAQLEIFQAETQKTLVAAQIPLFERKITQNLNQIALLLACSVNELTSLTATTGSIEDIPACPPAGLPSDLLRQRPDIRRAEKSLAAATAEIGVATADLFPKFSLAGSFGMQSSRFSELSDFDSRFWTVSPAVRLPVFNRKKLYAAKSLSEANRDELLATYEQTVLAAITETENTLVQFATERKIHDELQQATLTSRNAAAYAEELYAKGLTDLNDVLTSQRTQFQAEDQYIQSSQQLALTVVSLYKALGGGWEIYEKNSATPSQFSN